MSDFLTWDLIIIFEKWDLKGKYLYSPMYLSSPEFFHFCTDLSYIVIADIWRQRHIKKGTWVNTKYSLKWSLLLNAKVEIDHRLSSVWNFMLQLTCISLKRVIKLPWTPAHCSRDQFEREREVFPRDGWAAKFIWGITKEPRWTFKYISCLT